MDAQSPAEKMASLSIIDYEAIVNRDFTEIQKLVHAGQTSGMFFLDLRGPSTKAIFDDLPILFKTGNEFFNLPLDFEQKTSSGREGMERGYHALKGLEYYEIARDEFQLGKWVFPATFEPQKDRITRTFKAFNDAAQTILSELCASVNIAIPELSDDPTIPSDTALKLLYKPPIHDVGQVILSRHTDFGLLTLLWYDEVTTQLPIYNDEGIETEDWEAVAAVEGCILINIADDLEARSGGRLHSTVHRVVAPPGPKRPKNGLVYFLRPYKS